MYGESRKRWPCLLRQLMLQLVSREQVSGSSMARASILPPGIESPDAARCQADRPYRSHVQLLWLVARAALACCFSCHACAQMLRDVAVSRVSFGPAATSRQAPLRSQPTRRGSWTPGTIITPTWSLSGMRIAAARW